MHSLHCAAAAAFLVAGLEVTAAAQSAMQPTPPPAVTAEHLDWYQSGEPIAYDGNVYHPAGPVIHFIRNEMVPTGAFGRVPIYERTTREPGSVIYVPLAGGLMRPYERRRSGELAGTVGSTSPSFPVSLPSAEEIRGTYDGPVQTPFAVEQPYVAAPASAPAPAAAPAAAPASRPVGTTGVRAVPRGTRIDTGRSTRSNEVYVQFRGDRWLAAGPAIEFERGRFETVGEYHGLPVYRERGRRGFIFVPHVRGSNGLLTPYRRR